MATCPECDATLDLEPDDVDLDDRLSCDECGASLKVTSITPLEVDLDDDEEDEDDFDAALFIMRGSFLVSNNALNCRGFLAQISFF